MTHNHAGSVPGLDDGVNRIKAVLVPLYAADEIERLRTTADELAAAIEQWNVFADEYWPSLMCRPGTSALRNYKEQR